MIHVSMYQNELILPKYDITYLNAKLTDFRLPL